MEYIYIYISIYIIIYHIYIYIYTHTYIHTYTTRRRRLNSSGNSLESWRDVVARSGYNINFHHHHHHWNDKEPRRRRGGTVTLPWRTYVALGDIKKSRKSRKSQKNSPRTNSKFSKHQGEKSHAGRDQERRGHDGRLRADPPGARIGLERVDFLRRRVRCVSLP